jgi:hypothetical protein
MEAVVARENISQQGCRRSWASIITRHTGVNVPRHAFRGNGAGLMAHYFVGTGGWTTMQSVNKITPGLGG